MPNIKNLLVNGCSFTDNKLNTWATKLSQYHNRLSYCNIAASGAGNEYICNSTIHHLESADLDPADTLVIVMWSGTGRKDISLSGEMYYQTTHNKQYSHGAAVNDLYYLFSGGLTNSWMQNTFTSKIFNSMYKISDPLALCLDSLLNFVKLEHYLKANKYHYVFTSYMNYWDPIVESCMGGDYSIGFFCQDQSIYKNLNFSNWIFVNDRKDCLGEYARSNNLLDQTFHPTELGHTLFTNQVVLPELEQRFNLG